MVFIKKEETLSDKVKISDKDWFRSDFNEATTSSFISLPWTHWLAYIRGPVAALAVAASVATAWRAKKPAAGSKESPATAPASNIILNTVNVVMEGQEQAPASKVYPDLHKSTLDPSWENISLNGSPPAYNPGQWYIKEMEGNLVHQ